MAGFELRMERAGTNSVKQFSDVIVIVPIQAVSRMILFSKRMI